jgi:hypothetical protein
VRHRVGKVGRAAALRPRRSISDVDFLGDLDGVVELDAEVAHGALDLGMSERVGFILRISFLM